MFVREKTVNGYTYLYLVENVREDGRTKQRIIRNLGRKDAVLAAGDLDRLLASVGRFARQSIILGAEGEDGARVLARRIGGPLLFGRLWQRLGIGEVLEELLAGRQFGFAVERAVFVATLHRLFVSGSDRNCADWMESYLIEGSDGLALHHFYRAMAWLGEEIAPGVCQSSCPLNLFHAASRSCPAMGAPPPASWGSASAPPRPCRSPLGRSGLSQTDPTGSQFRVLPDQRAGFLARAA